MDAGGNDWTGEAFRESVDESMLRDALLGRVTSSIIAADSEGCTTTAEGATAHNATADTRTLAARDARLRPLHRVARGLREEVAMFVRCWSEHVEGHALLSI